jgi:hypothetical protein
MTVSFLKASIAIACQSFGPLLKLTGMADWRGNQLDPILVMWAFAGNESSFGKDCTPRFEPAYFSGRYSTEKWQAKLNDEYGEEGAKSYGPWQVMLCNAPGYAPSEFIHLEVCATVFIACMNRMIAAQKPTNLDQLADMYNSGNWRDRNVPEKYIADLRKHYDVPMPVMQTCDPEISV